MNAKIKEFEKLSGIPTGTIESLMAEDSEVQVKTVVEAYRKSQEDLWKTKNKAAIEKAAGDAAIDGYLSNKGKKELADLAGVTYTRKELDALTYAELKDDIKEKLNETITSAKTATDESVSKEAEQWKSKFMETQKAYDELESKSAAQILEEQNKATNTIKSFKRDNFLLSKTNTIDYAIESRKKIDQDYLISKIKENYDIVDFETGAIEKKGGGPAPSLDGTTTWTNVDQAIAFLDEQNKISKKSFGTQSPQSSASFNGRSAVVNQDNLTENQKKKLAQEQAQPAVRNGMPVV